MLNCLPERIDRIISALFLSLLFLRLMLFVYRIKFIEIYLL